ncbi:MAG: hypothetical protein J1E40_04285 [Oscillospiraceae bacterium]|nr:hypothetical protein [Oscillospiraceae bacterium]
MKKGKIILYIAAAFFYAWLLAELTYMHRTERVLFLFGYFLKEYDSLYILWGVLLVVTMILIDTVFSDKPKTKKLHTGIISGIAVLVIGIVPVVYNTVVLNSYSTALENLSFVDSKNAIVNECHEPDDTSAEITVYQLDGYVARKLGEVPAWLFLDDYIQEGKWDYTYDEWGRKLTVNIYYDEVSPFLKKEYDTGVWTQEFTLE